jgi:hypothetical protein
MPEDIFADLPPKAQDLGPPLALYRNRPGLGLAVWLSLILVRLVVGAAVVGLGLRAYCDPAGNPGTLPFVLLALSLVVGWWCVVSAVRLALRGRAQGNVRGVAHCPRGLVCVLRDRVIVAPWDEIDWVWDGGLRFRTRGGAEVMLPESLEGVGVLTGLVFRETFQRLAICASAVILGGGTVEFGPVKVTRTEIAVEDRRLAWADVGTVAAGWPRLRVFRKGERRPTLDVPIRVIPNLHALLALIDRLREGGFGSIVIGPGASEPPPDEDIG